MIATLYYPEHKRSGRKPAITWVLVMDSRRAQLFTQEPDAMAPMLIPVLDGALLAVTDEREVGRQVLPRIHESVGSARHAIEPRLDRSREAAKRLVQQVVSLLAEAKAGAKFDQLVIVAPKRIVGELRKQLGSLEKTVVAEVPKDLAYAPVGALSLYLAERNLL